MLSLSLNSVIGYMPGKVSDIDRWILLIKMVGNFLGIIAVCTLLWLLNNHVSSYQETATKILNIFEKREDAGRAALEAEIERIEIELKDTRMPAEKRQRYQGMLDRLKHKLDSSKLADESVTAGAAATGVR